MIETITSINIFWLVVFGTIVIISTFIIIGTVIIKLKSKDNSLFGNIFNNHVDEHIDTTDKFSKIHTEIIAGLPVEYQHELHSLEVDVQKNNDLINEIKKEINILADKIRLLENNK